MSADTQFLNGADDFAGHLGDRHAAIRCMARLGMAIQEPFQRWYADEAQRNPSFQIAAGALADWFGQMAGTMVACHPVAAHNAAIQEITRIAVAAMRERIADVEAGRYPPTKAGGR